MHEEQCECAACKYGFEELARMERASMEKYGWYAHIVNDYEGAPFKFNLHTHGMMESFGHTDFEIVLPMDPHVLMDILHNIAGRIKDGEKFVSGKRYTLTNEHSSLPVEFAESTENGRPVLRLILPDEDFSTNRANMKHPYVHQWEGIDGIVEEFEKVG